MWIGPLSSILLEEILASDISEILIISGHAKRAIEDHFDSSPQLERDLEEHGKTALLDEIQRISSINVHYVRQKHQNGLGDAISCARDFVDDEPFAVILGDDVVYSPVRPALRQLVDVYEETGATVLGCQEVPEEKVSSYGIVKGVETGRPGILKVEDMVEKPSIAEAPSRMAVLGRYVITPDVFDVLERTKPGKGGEIQLTDALRTMARREKVYACAFEGKRYDIGNKLGFLKATVEFALRREDLGADFRAYLKEVVKELP